MFKKVISVCIMMLFLFSVNGFAGKLDDFEKSAVIKKENKEDDNTENNNIDERDERNIPTEKGEKNFFEVLLGFIWDVLTGENKKTENNGEEWHETVKIETSFEQNIKGYGIKNPHLKIDYAFQHIDSKLQAADYRVEGGYGIFGAQARKTEFNENSPDDYLGVYYYHLFLRFSVAGCFEVNPGIGRITLDGNSWNSGNSYSIPVLYYPNKHIGLEFRPTFSEINGNSIEDYDFSVSYCMKNISFKTGYRHLSTRSQTLDGPYIGVSVFY